jgi:hypothetical protein
MTYMRHKIMQAVWDQLLDPEFMDAYENGVVVQCSDKIVRCLFPCIFTYSANYPEK